MPYSHSKNTVEIDSAVAILVPSCDKYADLWQPFFSLLNLYWPDCPYCIYLVSNYLEPKIEGVRTLKVGEDVSWSDSLCKALGMIKEDYVLLFLEDLFLSKHVNTASVLSVVTGAIESGANYIRLNPYPGPDVKITETIGLISPGSIYRASTVMSVWKKSVLNSLLISGENAWQFEIDGSKRSDKYGHFYSTYTDHINVVNAVIKSKWCREGITHMRRHGICPEVNARLQMTFFEEFTFFVKALRSKVFRLIPNKFRRHMKTYVARII